MQLFANILQKFEVQNFLSLEDRERERERERERHESASRSDYHQSSLGQWGYCTLLGSIVEARAFSKFLESISGVFEYIQAQSLRKTILTGSFLNLNRKF